MTKIYILGYKKQKFISFSCINVSIISPGLLNSTKFGELRLLSECFLLLLDKHGSLLHLYLGPQEGGKKELLFMS